MENRIDFLLVKCLLSRSVFKYPNAHGMAYLRMSYIILLNKTLYTIILWLLSKPIDGIKLKYKIMWNLHEEVLICQESDFMYLYWSSGIKNILVASCTNAI